jgi:MFS family permease
MKRRLLSFSQTLRDDPGMFAIVALGITQIIAWGSTLYMLGGLGKPIVRDTGWGNGVVFGGMTVGLLVASATSAWMGRQIDRHGGRIVMTIGSVLAGIGLLLLSVAKTKVAWFASWMVLGVAMRASLYDAAFAAIVQVTPSRGRRAISYLTLWGGFASTVFWPIGYWLDGRYGWRTTLVVFALVNLLVALPLHWFGLARREPATSPIGTASAEPAGNVQTRPSDRPLEGRPRIVGMVLFGGVLALSATVFGALSAQLVPLIEATGISAGLAVFIASLKGVAQVGGRVVELVWGQRLHAITVARISLAFMPLSFAVLLLGGATLTTALAFTLLFGISNGLVTIVRGALPLTIFGAKDYGAVLGLLATPYLLLNALAPVAFAMIADRWGYAVGGWVLLAVAMTAMAAMEFMAKWYRRQ